VGCRLALSQPVPETSFPQGRFRPTFRWEAGPAVRFRVEFSATSSFSGKVIGSGDRLLAATSYMPAKERWKAIRRLVQKGQPIYWRVIGYLLAPSALNDTVSPITSEQTWDFKFVAQGPADR